MPARSNPSAVSPPGELRRLCTLQSTGILDTPAEQEFDEIVALAAAICEVPISLISLVDADRQWFKAKTGLEVTQTPINSSFCAHAIRCDDLMIVHDAALDDRFAANPLVTGDPGIRFYAGFPLSAEDGSNIGTLCVIDRVPRVLTSLQQTALRVLGRQAMTRIQYKMRMAALAAALLEKERIAAELESSEIRFGAFLEALPAAAFIKDETGRMLFCNHAMTRGFDATPDQWIGKTDAEIWPPEMADIFRAKDLAVLQTGQAIRFDDEIIGPDSKTSSWDVSMFPFTDSQKRRFIAAIAIDVTQERQAKQALRQSRQQMRDLNLKLHKLSLTDGLTRVKNRRGLEDSLHREFERSRRSSAPLSLLMLDVDHFKDFNDAHGHVAGDQVLQRIAILMKDNTRKYDLIARYGGEEFVALLPDTLVQGAQMIAARLCHSISSDNWQHRCITVSVGVGTLQQHHATPGDFLNAVDSALYQAKHNGRNQVCSIEVLPPQLEKATA